MDNFMQSLAAGLISSLKYLDQGPGQTQPKEREKSLQNIIKVLELKMELSNKILQGMFFSGLTYLTEKGIHESEVILLLKLFELMFENYSKKPYFIPQIPDNIKFFALLAKCLVEKLSSEAKEIALRSSKLCEHLARFLTKENLTQFFPSLCSENIKIILDIKPKMYTKLLVNCLEFLRISLEKIFDNNSCSAPKSQISQTILDLTKKMGSSETEVYSSKAQPEGEKNFFTEAKKNLFTFFAMLKTSAHKYPKKEKLNIKFLSLFETIFEKCSNFFVANNKSQFDLLFDIYLHFLAQNESGASPVKILTLFPNVKYDLKHKQIKLFKQLPNLMNEVDTNLYLATFKRINIGLTIMKESQRLAYSEEEIETITHSFSKAFQITFRGKILLNDDSYNEFEPAKLIKVPLTPDYVSNSFHQFNQSWMRFIIAYLPITNFEEPVFHEISTMFSLIDEALHHSVLEYYKNQLYENKFRRSEELLTTLFLFLMMIKNSPYKVKDAQKLMDFFMSNPYQFVDPSNILRVKEHKLLIDLFTTQISFYLFQMIPEKSHILISRLLIYLFSKFYQENTLLCLLIWNCLITVTKLNYKDAKTLEDFMVTYSETLIRNFIDKLKIIHLLPDPEVPFKLLSSFVCFSDPMAVLKYSESLFNQLNNHFDKFYLKEDMRAIFHTFPIYKLIFECLDNSFKTNLEKSKEIIKTSNVIRRVLMRVKPFILQKDRHLANYTLQILTLSCRTLASIPMDTEDASVNFSAEDPVNTVIPESLGPIAWEFFEVIEFKIKKNEHPALVLECLKYMRNVQQYNQGFLVHERRFELKILPLICKFFQKVDRENLNNLEIKIAETTLSILNNIDLESYGATREELAKRIREFEESLNRFVSKDETANEYSVIKIHLQEIKRKFGEEKAGDSPSNQGDKLGV